MLSKNKKVEKSSLSESPTFKRALRESEKREEFRKYFVKLKRKLDLNQDLEQVIWTHLKAVGFDSPDSFDKGVENFGYRL